MGYINSQIGGTSQTISESEKVGPPGPKGDKGPAGPQGPYGPRGEKGATGPQGQKGSQGPQGLKGDKGDKGNKGDKGDKGHKGEKGDKVEKSDKGEKGDRGPQGSASGSANIDMQNKYDILRLKSNPYPVQGDPSKVINYQDTRNIFLSRKEGGKMEASIDMNNNTIYNVKYPVQVDQATNKNMLIISL